MARSILGVKPSPAPANSIAPRSSAGPRLTAAALDVRLRQRRSPTYVAALTKLDAGVHLDGKAATEALVAAIREELGDVEVESLPHGIVARCYLGPPHEVHTLDCSGAIIRHYKTYESLPFELERARALALHPEYAFIEVYSRRLIAVAASGQTAVIDL